MFSKPKNWISGGLWKPKNPHSLEHLKYLYNVLCKNQTVTEQNRSLLVETLRTISEILIWGDQNDSSVFDFFLEKNMLAFFLRFMRQKLGRYICVQLLQLLNILFENIRNETSVYYLLSNNYINSIIVHKFDFSDEEVMAYYISFLKTLSLKLNKHTIHFFYNEHTNDFALYTEAIKFFNHPESMVRIAVRTITLNVYRACRYNCPLDAEGQPLVEDRSMLRYIRDKTAAPYFSNLVWFIGNHVLELDACIRHDIDHNSRDRLADLVAEHLDHLHYLNDILCLDIHALNDVLTDHLLNRLLIPLYVYSLTQSKAYEQRSEEKPHISPAVSLFLLSQVFLIMHHAPLVNQLTQIILNGDFSVFGDSAHSSPELASKLPGFVKPDEPLAQTLDSYRGSLRRRRKHRNQSNSEAAEASGNRPTTPVEEEEEKVSENDEAFEEEGSTAEADSVDEGGATDQEAGLAEMEAEPVERVADPAIGVPLETSSPSDESVISPSSVHEASSPNQNSTDEEKLLQSSIASDQQLAFTLKDRPYLEALFHGLECVESDYEALFALCLLYALGHNEGINQSLLDTILFPTERSQSKEHYNTALVEKLINIITQSCQNGSKVRLATLELAIMLLRTLVHTPGRGLCWLQDSHLAAIEGAREEATLQLRNFYKSEEIFLDMFEDEHREMKSRPLNVEYLTMDASILLPPTGTPLTGIEFNKRLPCGEVERARRAIRVFFLLRDLSLTLRQEEETSLPLTKEGECIRLGDILDLNNSDLIACTVLNKDNRRERRFLVIDVLQLILVEPDSRRLGWGVVKFVGFLQDVEVTGDKEDSRSLHITIHRPATTVHSRPMPLLAARFLFDDHIRCMAAKQRLSKGRLKARQRKMQMIARLLELPGHIVDSMYQPAQFRQSASSLMSRPRTTTPVGRARPTPGGFIPGRSHPIVQSHSAPRLQSLASPITSQPIAFPEHRASQATPRSCQPRPKPLFMESSGSVEVEEAEEATPSPEAHAFQSLNESSQQQQQKLSSSPIRDGQDIPMEEISGRKFRAFFALPRRAISSEGGAKHRSSSYSPKRMRSKAESSASPSHKPLVRERTMSWSAESPASPASPSAKEAPRERSPSKTSQDLPCPKSLTPAKAPALSLVLSCDSPPTPSILMPPADETQIHSLSGETVPSPDNVTDDLKKTLQQS